LEERTGVEAEKRRRKASVFGGREGGPKRKGCPFSSRGPFPSLPFVGATEKREKKGGKERERTLARLLLRTHSLPWFFSLSFRRDQRRGKKAGWERGALEKGFLWLFRLPRGGFRPMFSSVGF
jgi:hypothetical protein